MVNDEISNAGTEWDGAFQSLWDIHGEELLSHAFRSVTHELKILGGASLSETVLEGVRVDVLQSIHDPKAASRLLHDALKGLDWYWPRWEASAEALAGDSLVGVLEHLRDLPVSDLLNELSKDEARTLAVQCGKEFPKAATAKSMRQWLLGSMATDALGALLTGYRSELISKSLNRLRLEIASGVVRRISAVVHETAIRAEYAERLQNPVLMQMRPNCQFHCAPLWGEEPPEQCRQWHGRVLPLREALEQFPQLPCDSLACSCRLVTCK